jgi:endo-1,4-beta-xylanase
MSQTSLSRRDMLRGSAASGAGLLLPDVALSAGEPPGLGDIAAKAGILFGAAMDKASELDPAYGQLFNRHTGLIVTENATKFGSLQPNQGVFDFSAADGVFDYAKAHGKKAHAAALIWNDDAPAWLKGRPGREIERIFDAHIERVVSRYAGRVISWEVVNEPFFPLQGKPGGYRDGPWFAAMGSSYIPRALRRVAAIDKSARLVVNEAFCESNHAWGRANRPLFKGLADRLLDDGVPLHAVGFQSHLISSWSYDDQAFQAYVAEFGARGLDVYLSELDVNDEVLPEDNAVRDKMVAGRYEDYLKAVLAVPAVKRVVTWGLADRYSWWRYMTWEKSTNAARLARPLPFDDSMKRKPAYEAMARAFAARRA